MGGGGAGPVGPGWCGNKLQLNTIQYNTLHTIRKLLFARTACKHKFSAIAVLSRLCPGWHDSCFYCVTYLSQVTAVLQEAVKQQPLAVTGYTSHRVSVSPDTWLAQQTVEKRGTGEGKHTHAKPAGPPVWPHHTSTTAMADPQGLGHRVPNNKQLASLTNTKHDAAA